MAKTQRWRRGGSVGEGTTSAADSPPDPPLTGADEATTDDVIDAPDEQAEEFTPAAPAATGDPSAESDDDAELGEEVGEDLGSDLGAEFEDDLAADLDPDHETGLAEVSAAEDAESAESADELDLDVDDAAEADVELDDEVEIDSDEDDAALDDESDDAETDDESDDSAEDEDSDTDAAATTTKGRDRFGADGYQFSARKPGDLVPVQLLQAAHAKQAIGTALAVGLVAAIAGRPAREAAIVLLTVLVGQTILGWHNDIVDRERDQRHDVKGKPIAAGKLLPETAWYAIVVAALVLVPLAITTGIRAGSIYLGAVAISMLGNILLREGFFSWWSWAASFALLPAYLSYGGWGGQAIGTAPETVIVILAALLGVGIHFMRAVWGLVADHEDGWTYLPLKLGLKLGATRLLALSTVYTAVIVILLLVMGAKVGLSR